MTQPIQTPITGREELGDLSRPEQALAQFYRGLNGRDLALLAENWEPSDDAAMDNPLGGIARGWPAIRALYERLFASDGRLSVEFHDYTIHESDSLFYAVGRERGASSAARSGSTWPSAPRASFVAWEAGGARSITTARSRIRPGSARTGRRCRPPRA